MNNGFLVYESNKGFVLKKIPTPENPKTYITEESQEDTSVKIFDTFLDAVKEADSLCEVSKPEEVKNIWNIQMRYNHKGLGVRFFDFGETLNVSYKEAVEMAKQEAEKFANDDDMIEEDWDVKVVPVVKK